MEANKRLDILVSEILNCPREYAKELITQGKCTVNNKQITKPGAKFNKAGNILIDADPPKYVSRGGLKLAHALKIFQINLQDTMCMDVGASTGGFTDCMLQNGAKCVIAIENGTAQLHKSLMDNPQIMSLENTDIRNIDRADLPFLPQFICADLSFISLTLVIPKLFELLIAGGKMVLLIKPQFEVGKGKVDKHGVAKCPKEHVQALKRVIHALNNHGLCAKSISPSPVQGQAGNIEYLLLAEHGNAPFDDHKIQKVVKDAFSEFKQ